MDIITGVLYIVMIVVYVYLKGSVLYMLLYSFLGLFKAKTKIVKIVKQTERKIAVYIPGYKEDSVIVEVAKSALEQSYCKSFYDIIVIADSFKKETLDKLNKLNIEVVEVNFEKSTKAKALKKAMSFVYKDKYDVALILDADNIMEQKFIEKINNSFNNGYDIVQGHRVAKNFNTNYAILDAVSEELNNTIYSKGQRVIGMSSRLVGSGMAFNYELFRDTMNKIDAVGGFDKELELRLLREGYEFEYLEGAYIYDEKVDNSEVMVNQRTRWIAAQFHYLNMFFVSSIKHVIKNRNIDFFNKTLQMALPPRLILPGVLAITSVVSIIIGNSYWSYAWSILFILNVIAYLVAVPLKYYNSKLFTALLQLPMAFTRIFISLFKIKGANKEFIHTPHKSGNVDNNIINDQ